MESKERIGKSSYCCRVAYGDGAYASREKNNKNASTKARGSPARAKKVRERKNLDMKDEEININMGKDGLQKHLYLV